MVYQHYRPTAFRLLEAVVKVTICSYFGQGQSYLCQGILKLILCVNHVSIFTIVSLFVLIHVLSHSYFCLIFPTFVLRFLYVDSYFCSGQPVSGEIKFGW